MAINFPVSLDDLANVSTGDTITPAHKNDLNDIVEALEAKVGIDSSAVATSHDYLLTHLPGQAANWDAGAVEVRAQTFESDIATGTAPFTIASTTVSANLNADLLDGNHAAAFQTVLTNSAGLAAALSDETGTGLAVFNTTPTLVTPVLGVATATTINKVTITAPASGSTLTIADGKTLTVTDDVTLSGSPYMPGGTDVAIADGGTGAGTAAAAINALLPSQTGNANKFLQSDATNPSWQTVDLATDVTGTLNLATNVTGTLPIANGGTGTTTAALAWAAIGGLGAWVDKSASYGAQQASTDGFVTVYAVSGAGAGIAGYGYSDGNADPTTVRTGNACPVSSFLGLILPVKKSDYWKIVFTGTPASIAVYWIPIGN